MSLFSEFLEKINEIRNGYLNNSNDDLEEAYLVLENIKEEYLNSKRKARDKSQKDKTHTKILQSIHEDEDETSKEEDVTENRSKKRSKHEVEDMQSPEVEKRQKRIASVKAQSIISEQIKGPIRMLDENTVMVSIDRVNLKLTEKLRRETSTKKPRRRKNDDKENEPMPTIQIKQEKISLPPEPVTIETVPIKREINEDIQEMEMPPPPMPKPRKKVDKVDAANDEDTSRRRTTRNRKQTDSMITQTETRPVGSSRARLTQQDDTEKKRTRGKKGRETMESEKEMTIENGTASPAEKPRPKRTRKARKVSEKQETEKKTDNEIKKEKSDQEEIPPKECIENNIQSPLLQKIIPKVTKHKYNDENDTIEADGTNTQTTDDNVKKKIINQMNCTVTINNDMDKTVVLTNSVYNHAPVTSKAVCQINETVVLELKEEEQKEKIMNETVVLEKVSDKAPTVQANDSLLTDDESLEMHTPPNKQLPEPTSAVKEKVQQFEEMATRVTRTKTRAMAKKEIPDQTDKQTPPDRTKPIISTDTLTKMNSLIFNGKPPQISTSACKPRTNIPLKIAVPTSASKINVTREDERGEKEDARRKKEAMLEAKRELQKRKREEKMSAAAAARTAAENMRRAALQAAEKDRRERQIQADQGRQERLKEVEKKKLEQARKAAETEERRKMEEAARASRLQNEQRKMEEARRRQLEEEKIMKKEAAQMEREIERKQKEFIEKMKMKKLDGDRTPNKMVAMEPVYMQDGFQHLNSDEEEQPERPAPIWGISKNRRIQLTTQALLLQNRVDKLFSVRGHTPNLKEIFPNIERARLKRTSSAVWRTPPRLATLDE